jgi:hypothetical protein
MMKNAIMQQDSSNKMQVAEKRVAACETGASPPPDMTSNCVMGNQEIDYHLPTIIDNNRYLFAENSAMGKGVATLP